jgi:hypothetical protein
MSLLGQALFGEEGGYSWIFQVIFFIFIFVWIFYGQRMQVAMWNRAIEGSLHKLSRMKDEARTTTIKSIKEQGKPEGDPTPRIDQFLERFFIQPVDMDPAGIVPKFDHLLDIRDMSMKEEVKRIAPKADDSKVNNLENLMEAAMDLNLLYRIVRHYYLFAKRTKSYIITAQLQMLLPQIMDIAQAYNGAIQAFSTGQPVGDGAGPLLINRLMRNKEFKKIEKDMVMAETSLEGRNVTVLKAEGPGGNVGKPGDALKTIIDTQTEPFSMVIMIDAALKFEGENTGDVSEGIGAAIGGIGTERFKIEETATKNKIPVFAVIVKQSIKEAIAPMKKEIYEGVDKALERVKRIIKENTKEGDRIIIAGIGNTIGIGQ